MSWAREREERKKQRVRGEEREKQREEGSERERGRKRQSVEQDEQLVKLG